MVHVKQKTIYNMVSINRIVEPIYHATIGTSEPIADRSFLPAFPPNLTDA